MDTEGKHLIVIGRQFGSGGRYIGRLLAEDLGFGYYDRELLSEAAGDCGFSADIFTCADERPPSPLRSLLHLDYGYPDIHNPSTLSCEGIYKAQSEVIRKICARESCVIVGRTADYVMRDHPGLLSVFLHAPLADRCRRIVARGDCLTEREAADMARKNDRKRSDYYNYFTGRRWGHADNYDISLNASRIEARQLVAVIRAAACL